MADIAFVTGCATGIGRALALELHHQRTAGGKPAYKVIATDINYEVLRSLEEEEGISIAQLDVTDPESIQTVVQKVLAEHGRIDMLVCNAGLCKCDWLVEAPYSNIEQMFNVNVHGVFKVVQAVAPHMMERRSGKIAVMASVNAWVVRPGVGSYSATKAALSMLTDALRMELYPFDIQVVKIVPGWVKSDLMTNLKGHFARYDTPKSRYQICTEYIYALLESFKKQGITAEQAARDMVKGLSKAKPPSVIKTGTWLNWALFWGFCQQYISADLVAGGLNKESGLVRLHEQLHSQEAKKA